MSAPATPPPPISLSVTMAQAIPKSSIGLDLGGSLCKICYFERKPSAADNDQEVKFRTIARQLMASPASYVVPLMLTVWHYFSLCIKNLLP